MIEESALIVVSVLNPRIPRKQMPRQLEHVVGIACFTSLRAKTSIKFSRCTKVLVLTIPANHVTVEMHHTIPEKLGRSFVGEISGQLVSSSETDQLRNLSIRMQTLESILLSREWIEHGLMMK